MGQIPKHRQDLCRRSSDLFRRLQPLQVRCLSHQRCHRGLFHGEERKETCRSYQKPRHLLAYTYFAQRLHAFARQLWRVLAQAWLQSGADRGTAQRGACSRNDPEIWLGRGEQSCRSHVWFGHTPYRSGDDCDEHCSRNIPPSVCF